MLYSKEYPHLLVSNGKTLKQLREEGYTVRQCMYRIWENKEGEEIALAFNDYPVKSFHVKSCRDSFSIKELMEAEFSDSEILDFPFEAKQLKTIGITAKCLLKLNIDLDILVSAGYRYEDFNEAGISVADFIEHGYSVSRLKKVGFSATVLKEEGLSIGLLTGSEHLSSELKNSAPCEISRKYIKEPKPSPWENSSALSKILRNYTIDAILGKDSVVQPVNCQPESRKGMDDFSKFDVEYSSLNESFEESWHEYDEHLYEPDVDDDDDDDDWRYFAPYSAEDEAYLKGKKGYWSNWQHKDYDEGLGGISFNDGGNIYWDDDYDPQPVKYWPIFSVKQLKEAGFDDKSIIKQGLIKNSTMDDDEYRSQLKEVYTIDYFVKYDYSAEDLFSMKYSVTSVKDANVKEGDIIAAGFKEGLIEELLDNYSIKVLNKHNVPADALAKHCTPQQLIDGGYSRPDIAKCKYPVQALHELNIDASYLIYEYHLRDILDGGYTTDDLRGKVPTHHTHFNALLMHNYGCTAQELKEIGYSPDQILEADYALRELIPLGYSDQQLSRKFTMKKIKAARSAIEQF